MYKVAELDKMAKIITYGILILFSLFIIFNIIYTNNLLATFGLIGILVLSKIFSPISYTIKEDYVSIDFLLFSKKIHKNEIIDVRIISSKELSNSIRTFAIGGLFGYNGYFYNPKFGKMIWFATNRNYYLLLSLNNSKYYVISPKQIKNFVNDFFIGDK